MDAEWVSAIAEAAAALLGAAAVIVAWLGWKAARHAATSADRATASAERNERIAAEVAELEKRRQYIDLTPQFEVTLDRVEHGGNYGLWTELVGPPGLDGLDSMTIEVRDDWRDRTYRPSGDLTAEDIARHVWSPLRFAPNVDGADATGRSPEAFALQVGDVHRSLMCRTTKPPWALMSDDQWWTDLYANEPTRLLLTCTRGDQQWVVPHKLPPLPRRTIRRIDGYVESRE